MRWKIGCWIKRRRILPVYFPLVILPPTLPPLLDQSVAEKASIGHHFSFDKSSGLANGTYPACRIAS
jgi:hypothetical protein